MTPIERVPTVVRRWRNFLDAPQPGHFLVDVRVPAESLPTRPINSFDLDRQLGEYLDERITAARPGWSAKAGLDDDTLPAFAPSFGISEHSAWMGLDVRLQEWTSLPVPKVDTRDDLARLGPDPAAPWYRRMEAAYAHCRARQEGTFFLSVRGTMTPMDLANAVRGDELFVDFLADPEFAHLLVARMAEWMPWYYDRLRGWCDDIAGGRLFNSGEVWMPEPSLGHISNDAAMLCSPAVYEEFGHRYEEPLFRRFRHVLYHIHNQQMAYVPRLAQLPNLGLVEVTHDPKTAAPIDDLPRILAATGSANLLLHATSDQLRARIGELRGRNVLFDVTCRDRADAADVLRLVRDRSKPL